MNVRLSLWPFQDRVLSELGLSRVMRILQKLSKHLAPVHNRSRGHGVAERHFSDEGLVAAHLLSMALTNRKKQQQIVKLTMAAAFGNAMATDYVSHHVPSYSFLRKRLVMFDAAMMLLKRQQDTSDKFRWIWADSSPQGGYDWLQIKELSINVSEVVTVADAVDELAKHNSTSDEVFLEDGCRLHEVLERHMRIHMRIPTAKSSGHSLSRSFLG